MDLRNIDPAILTALVTVIVAVLTGLSSIVGTFFFKKMEELKDKIDDDRLTKYIDIANEAVITAVGAVAQVMVDSLKAAAVDGVLSSDEAKAAFEEAKARSLAIMGLKGQKAVKELYGDFDAWLINKIDFYVGKRKSDKNQSK